LYTFSQLKNGLGGWDAFIDEFKINSKNSQATIFFAPYHKKREKKPSTPSQAKKWGNILETFAKNRYLLVKAQKLP